MRGVQIGAVTQNPRGAFNPLLRIGEQLVNIHQSHCEASKEESRARALEMLNLVGIADPERRLNAFPHELSGGMAQRALIAAALMPGPRLLIADEPTTGLDVTVQAQVLDDLARAARETGTGVLLVTHDLGVVANYCDRVYLMHAGEVVEEAGCDRFFTETANPASLSLVASQLGHADAELRLQGHPINQNDLPPGCWLHPRCPFADEDAGCMSVHPELVEVATGHRTRCHRASHVAEIARVRLDELKDAPPRTREPVAHPVDATPVLDVRNVDKRFVIKDEVRKLFRRREEHLLKACSDVSFTAFRGETIGVIGESGSGKTTLGRMVCGLIPPTAGEVRLHDRPVIASGKNLQRDLRSNLQIVFQEPVESLNPMMTIGQQIVEPLQLLGGLARAERKRKASELLNMVGLSESLVDRLPSQLSGGQLQRASIARAIATDPDVVVLDEPTAQLSPEAEKYVLVLLDELQQRLGLTYVYISHDLSLVRSICDRVLIMYLGQIVEIGTAEEVFENPQHPYTRTLIGSILRPDPRQRAERAERERVTGEIPSPIDLPEGCFLAGRCEHATDRCRVEPQALEPAPDGRPVRCWRARAGELVDLPSPLGTKGLS